MHTYFKILFRYLYYVMSFNDLIYFDIKILQSFYNEIKNEILIFFMLTNHTNYLLQKKLYTMNNKKLLSSS